MGVRYAIGLMLTLWALHIYFADTFAALDDAATASLITIEAAATQSTKQIEQMSVE